MSVASSHSTNFKHRSRMLKIQIESIISMWCKNKFVYSNSQLYSCASRSFALFTFEWVDENVMHWIKKTTLFILEGSQCDCECFFSLSISLVVSMERTELEQYWHGQTHFYVKPSKVNIRWIHSVCAKRNTSHNVCLHHPRSSSFNHKPIAAHSPHLKRSIKHFWKQLRQKFILFNSKEVGFIFCVCAHTVFYQCSEPCIYELEHT